jgi:FSR family fosmidomycin resistance protein-like MFS transporter
MMGKGEPSLGRTAYLALGHFITDLYPAFLPPLLPLLVEKFQLSFTRADLLATVMGFSASLTQPIFGYLSDKLGGRRMIIWGPVVSGLSFSLIGLAPHYSFLVLLLILGGLGIFSFHPEVAALTASISGRKRTLIMSIFMLGGTMGIGPGGVGGKTTALAVKIGLAYTHTAICPVAVNFHCWVGRRFGFRFFADGKMEDIL